MGDSPEATAEIPDAYLVLREGRTWRDVFRLDPALVVTIGRDPNNRVVVNDARCSRYHCELFHDGRRWVVRDLKSRNGTLVTGSRLRQDRALAEGDIVRIGKTEMLFTNQSSPAAPASDESLRGPPSTLHATNTAAEPKIVQRKSTTRFMTESALFEQGHASARSVFGQLYNVCARMFAAEDVDQLAETVLESVLASIHADIGAILLLPHDVDTVDPDELDLICYKAPAGKSYQRVSNNLSRTVLQEREAVLAKDIRASGDAPFDSLNEIEAESVICAPLRTEGVLLGLLHLYSSNAQRPLDVDSLDFALAVADQLAINLAKLQQQESLTEGLRSARDENRSLRRLLEIESELVGDSRPMLKLRETIARVAASDATAMIRGESGVGKELVARAIHFNSDRREAPFVCLNCAALTESLLESELFGHEKGAFTGATSLKTGKFEQAHQGTLFLDEVGEMPLSVQAKFLRVLEGHSFERVGGDASIAVDVRVVAATNRALEEAVDDKAFRKDLFFRLQILELHVPALRDHADDIPALTAHFLERCCQRMGLAPRTLQPEALQVLCEYEWPGNVRELKNVIERAVVLADNGPDIQATDLRFSALANPRTEDATDEQLGYRPVALEEIEREHIARTMQWTKGKKREAARLLGINRSTLDRKLQRYQIQLPDDD